MSAQNYATKTHCSGVGRVGDAMPCRHRTGNERHDISYTFYEKKKQKTKAKRKSQRKNGGAPPQGMWHTLGKNEPKKQHHYYSYGRP